MDEARIEHVGKCLLIRNKKEKILVIGDLHLGYENTLSAGGVFVKRFLLTQTLADLSNILKECGRIDEVVLLGDIKHNFGSVLKQEWTEIDEVVSFLKEGGRKIILVKGNHDVLVGGVGKRLNFEIVDYYIKKGVAFIHGNKDFDEIWDKKIETVILGHMHPAVTIEDGAKREKYKCFLEGKYLGKEIIVLPSFTEINKGSDPRDFEKIPWKINFNKFNVFVVDDDMKVYSFGLLKDFSN